MAYRFKSSQEAMPSLSGETITIMGLLQRIKELEQDLKRLQGEIQKYLTEQESIQSQLAEKAKVTAWV